ncbi:alpha/beta hydrolase [Streptomyces sp. NPDC002896]|uniref:alpha/beta hydrolase n=1 Tax=Streptomyces sp. NPDC002896 TaxID=3154438 RepID=UPI003318FB14
MTILDADAAAIVEAMEKAGIPPLYQVGLQAARARAAAVLPSPTPEMTEVTDSSFEGPHGTVPVRVYRPTETANAPAIVYFHGGGMIMGTLDTFDGLARNLAASCEAVVISVDYRLAPEHPYPVANDEAYEALAWAHRSAHDLRIDPARIAVAGDSAGGTLAAAAALHARDESGPPILAQLLFYPGVEREVDRPSMAEFADGPVITRGDIVWMKNAYLGPDPSTDTAYGVPALTEDLSGLPDAIVVSAEADPIRDGVEEYGQRLRAAGVPTALLRYPGVCHGFLSQAASVGRARTAFAEIGALTRTKFAAAR